MRAQSSAATAALSCGGHSLAGGAAAKILRLIDFAGTAGLRLALRRPWQMRLKPVLYSNNPRLQPMRLHLQLRQHLRCRMSARRQRKRKVRKSKVHKRKTNCAACSFAGCAAARILRLIDSAATAALLGTLRCPLQMRRCNRRLPLRRRQYLRRRMPNRRQRKRKMYGRKFRWRKANCAAFWRGFAARLRRFPTGL